MDWKGYACVMCLSSVQHGVFTWDLHVNSIYVSNFPHVNVSMRIPHPGIVGMFLVRLTKTITRMHTVQHTKRTHLGSIITRNGKSQMYFPFDELHFSSEDLP